MQYFIQPLIPKIVSENKYEGLHIPSQMEMTNFWFSFHKKLLKKYGELNQRKYSCIIEKEMQNLLRTKEVNFFVALSYFIEKLRFYKQERVPGWGQCIGIYIRGSLEMNFNDDGHLRMPYRAMSLDLTLVPNFASFLFGLKRSKEYLMNYTIMFPKNINGILQELSENQFPKKLEFRDVEGNSKFDLSSANGYKQFKDQDIKKRTLIKMFQKLSKAQKMKAREFIQNYHQQEGKSACLPV